MPKGIYIRTEKHKASNRLGHLGKHLSEETKAKLRLSRVDSHCSEETKAKIRFANIGKRSSVKARANMSLAHLGKHRPELSLILKGRHLTERHKANISKAIKEIWAKPRYKERLRQIQKLLWQAPEFRDERVRAIILGARIRPTKPELQLLKLLEANYPNEWTYVGDGQLVIGGLNPDFTNINGKKQVIELYGDYWHDPDIFPNTLTEEKRIALYQQYGYKCLIIWEHELDKPQEVIKKVVSFAKRNWLSKLKTIFSVNKKETKCLDQEGKQGISDLR